MVHEDHDDKPRVVRGASEIEAPKGLKFQPPVLVLRLAASVVDFAIYGFVGSALISPFQRQFREAQMLGDSEGVFFALALAALFFLLGGVVYQAVFLAVSGTTPGKKAFGLRVVDVWTGKKPTVMESIVRGALWWFGWCTLGFAFIGIYSDRRGRPFHDRVSDTMVVPVDPKKAGLLPSPEVVLSVRRLLAFGAIVLAVGLLLEFSVNMRRGSDESWIGALEGLSPELCSDVSDVIEEYKDEEASRLSIALTLFAAGTIESECVEQEAVHAFRNGKEKELAYLARAFSYSDDPELSDSYLEKVCVEAPKSEACEFSGLVEAWTNEDWEEASAGFRRLLPASGLFMKVWAVKHFERVKDFASEIDVIEKIGSRRELANFLGSHRVVALWGLHRKAEARAAMVSSLDHMESGDRMSLSSWVCYRELAETCGEQTPIACGAFENTLGRNLEYLSSASVAATDIRREECQTKGKMDFARLREKHPREDAKAFLAAIEMVRGGKTDQAKELLWEIVKDEENDRVFHFEAREQLARLADGPEEIEKLVLEWRKMDPTTWEWRIFGNTLASRLLKLKDYRRATGVAAVLLEDDPKDPLALKTAVSASFKSGDKATALRLLKTTSNERMPASIESSLGESENKE